MDLEKRHNNFEIGISIDRELYEHIIKVHKENESKVNSLYSSNKKRKIQRTPPSSDKISNVYFLFKNKD